MTEFKMNIDEIKVALYALNNASLNNFRGEFVVPLSNLMHRLHDALVREQQPMPPADQPVSPQPQPDPQIPPQPPQP